MISLTNEENKSYREQKVCPIVYARKNLAVITMTMELHSKNIFKSKIIVILLINIAVLLIIFVI